jgi:hypothetical protein
MMRQAGEVSRRYAGGSSAPEFTAESTAVGQPSSVGTSRAAGRSNMATGTVTSNESAGKEGTGVHG